ncbi:MAG: DUF4340 domain-containing protein [Chloroflexi bacterium]|nr:DUF4340 domain-containing protein [Chloroflexota bacterium]
MSFKTTGILLLVLALLGSYAYLSVANKPPPVRPQTPYVYSYEMTDIVRIEVRYQDRSISLLWDAEKGEWKYPDPARGEVDSVRVNGIRLLLSGPGARRVLLQERTTPEQIREYGLANPQVAATIALKDGRVHRVLLGDRTPDGANYYTKNDNSDTIYLVDFTWGNELIRFINEPPDKKPVE